MVWAEAWGAALLMAQTLGVGVGRGVAVPMLCGGGWPLPWLSRGGAVAVAVAVAVLLSRDGRCRRGVGVGVDRTPPTAAKDIDATPTIDVVWRARVAALSRSDVDSRVIQGIAARRKLVSQAGNSRPQQGHCAGDVRSGHGCAAEIRV